MFMRESADVKHMKFEVSNLNMDEIEILTAGFQIVGVERECGKVYVRVERV